MFLLRRSTARLRSLALIGMLVVTSTPWAQTVLETPSNMVAIVSPKYPRDSRGEVVYERQGKSQMDQPVVPGSLMGVTLVHAPRPKYPRSLKKAHATGDVKVDFIVAQDGAIIDPVVASSSNQDLNASALDFLKKYRFKAATLSGKPIASFNTITVTY